MDLLKKETKPYIPFTFYHVVKIENKQYADKRRSKYVNCRYLCTNKYVTAEFYKIIFNPLSL